MCYKLNIVGYKLSGEDHPPCKHCRKEPRCYYCDRSETEIKIAGDELTALNGEVICTSCIEDPQVNLSIMEGGM